MRRVQRTPDRSNTRFAAWIGTFQFLPNAYGARYYLQLAGVSTPAAQVYFGVFMVLVAVGALLLLPNRMQYLLAPAGVAIVVNAAFVTYAYSVAPDERPLIVWPFVLLFLAAVIVGQAGWMARRKVDPSDAF